MYCHHKYNINKESRLTCALPIYSLKPTLYFYKALKSSDFTRSGGKSIAFLKTKRSQCDFDSGTEPYIFKFSLLWNKSDVSLDNNGTISA